VNVKLIIAGIILSAGFASGWWVNGNRWEADYRALESSVVDARAEGEKNARQAIEAVYRERMNELQKALNHERAVMGEHIKRAHTLEARNAEIEQQYREALKDPDCAQWAAEPIACPASVYPELSGDSAGDRGSTGADPVADDSARVIETVLGGAGTTDHEWWLKTAVVSFTDRAAYV